MYASFIVAILVIEHPALISTRIRINSVSWPSIFHARAWREYQGLAREYMNLTFLSEELRNRND